MDQENSISTPDEFIKLPEVLKRCGIKKACLYRMMKLGEFPAQVKLTKRAVGWDRAEVEQWRQAKKRARGGGEDSNGDTASHPARRHGDRPCHACGYPAST